MSAKGKRHILTAAMIAAVFVVLSVVYARYITVLLTNESQMHLSEVAVQGASSVRRQVFRDFDILEVLADGIISNPQVPLEEKIARIKQQAEKFDLFRIGIADLQGNAITSDGQTFSVADRDHFQSAVKGKRLLSRPIIDKVDGVTPVIVYAVPVYHDGQVVNVLFATYEQEKLLARIDVSFYHKMGVAFIANSAGDILLHPNQERQGRNIIEVAGRENTPQQVQTFRAGLEHGGSGVVRFCLNGEDRFFAYAPIEDVNHWSLITSLPTAVVFERSQKVILLTLLLLAAVSVFFTLTAVYIAVSRRKAGARMEKLAYYDPLTGAANLERFQLDAGALFREVGAQRYTLVQFDIKQFRYLNRDLGYAAGNDLLIHVTRSLGRVAQKDETFARVGPDQFLLLFLNRGSAEETGRYIEALRQEIVGWEKSSSGYYSPQLVFGVYHIDAPDVSLQAAIERANIARKSIKESYETHVAVYDTAMQSRIDWEKALESAVPSALKNGEFKLFIQPKYDLITEKIVGGEALVRWFKPDGSMIMPGDFIPLLEKNGAIYDLDMYMLGRVCRFVRAQLNRSLFTVPISINQSRCYMYRPTYVSAICAELDGDSVPPELIELEITENVVYTDMDKLIDVLETLHQKGFAISLDDFGSGYSSLNVLKDLRVDVLKLDRFMLSETLNSQRQKTVVANIIKMAKELNMSVVAEGVETKAQVDFLRAFGCETAQGYYYSKPVPAETFGKMLQESAH